ncbi:MAG: phosphopyruvate hydratase [Anaplasmataceae bacterium]|nr:phosphopyruvate hydratase [Anaplasmataceae bacterium]
MKIREVKGRQILDSRGTPTVEADVILENGSIGRASVPSGASTGSREAVELRDGDPQKFGGKSVLKAVDHINNEIKQALAGKEIIEQEQIDQALIQLDGTPNKERLGANAILAASLAAAKAGAKSREMPLFAYLMETYDFPKEHTLPLPMVNIINGGKHALHSTDIQEFMILPVGANSFSESIHMSANVFRVLKEVLESKGYSTTVGDEGGYAPTVKNGNQEALSLMTEAISKAGYELQKDFLLALDVAASTFYENGKYNLRTESKQLSREEMIDWLDNLTKQFPIVSIEDGLVEDDWEGWALLTEKIGNRIQLVGDDLLVTNSAFLSQALNSKAGNTILIKPNQIGTLTETVATTRMAQQAGWKTIISHRSGETEDTTISHLAVGLNVPQIKTGSVSRTDRTCKYNELLRIEEMLGSKGMYAGRKALAFS